MEHMTCALVCLHKKQNTGNSQLWERCGPEIHFSGSTDYPFYPDRLTGSSTDYEALRWSEATSALPPRAAATTAARHAAVDATFGLGEASDPGTASGYTPNWLAGTGMRAQSLV